MPRQVMTALLDAYAAPSISEARDTYRDKATDLFQQYAAQVNPDVPLIRLRNSRPPRYEDKQLEGDFPFQLHNPREGEPPVSLFAEVDLETLGVDTAGFEQQMEQYKTWTESQPDRVLLQTELSQRRQWMSSHGRVTAEQLISWWTQRYFAAHRVTKAGHGDVITQYWSGNRETQVEPPTIAGTAILVEQFSQPR